MSRANCWQKKGQVDKAVGDYSKVIEFSPKYSDAYLSRGKLFAAMDDEEKAVADFDRFVSLKPRNAQVYFDLAQICWKSDNDERAVKYLDQALKYNPRYAKAYLLKALISLCDRNGADTVSNALTYINIKGLENKSVPYAYAYAYLGYRLAKKEVKAKDVLDEFLKSSNSLSWPNPIVKYLRGQISQTHLLKLANDSSKKFQAKSYIAMKAYLDNRKKNALEIFQELIDSCGDEQKTDADSSQHQPPLRRLDEYRIAKAYLDYLMLESDDRGPDDVEATETSN
jgi:tetratricopeptide (TPR) repeat protein